MGRSDSMHSARDSGCGSAAFTNDLDDSFLATGLERNSATAVLKDKVRIGETGAVPDVDDMTCMTNQLPVICRHPRTLSCGLST
jgi:hypothetical protein